VAVAEKDPTAEGPVNDVAVNEDEPLRAKVGGCVVAMSYDDRGAECPVRRG